MDNCHRRERSADNRTRASNGIQIAICFGDADRITNRCTEAADGAVFDGRAYWRRLGDPDRYAVNLGLLHRDPNYFRVKAMGVLYSAFPVTGEVREWLAEEGHPVPAADGTQPTPNQLQKALQTLADQNVSYKH
ncbi:MAG: hypothetical protein AAFN77_24335 [Planctomycetota bacterium]